MNRIPKDIMITRQDLIDWLDKPLSNEDMDLIDYIVNRLENFYKLDEEIVRLNEIIDEALYYLEIDMIGTAIDKLKELKKEGKE